MVPSRFPRQSFHLVLTTQPFNIRIIASETKRSLSLLSLALLSYAHTQQQGDRARTRGLAQLNKQDSANFNLPNGQTCCRCLQQRAVTWRRIALTRIPSQERSKCRLFRKVRIKCCPLLFAITFRLLGNRLLFRSFTVSSFNSLCLIIQEASGYECEEIFKLQKSCESFRYCGENLATTAADRRRQKINNVHKNSLEGCDTFMSPTIRKEEKRKVTVEWKIVSLSSPQ